MKINLRQNNRRVQINKKIILNVFTVDNKCTKKIKGIRLFSYFQSKHMLIDDKIEKQPQHI